MKDLTDRALVGSRILLTVLGNRLQSLVSYKGAEARSMFPQAYCL